MNSQRIVVTGGAGFIGSHLVERLLADGADVTVIDDLSTGRRENLAAVAGHARLTVLESKVSEAPRLRELTAQSDLVFHLAAAVGVELVVNSPTRTIQNNLRETEFVLEAARLNKTPVVLASTSEVYGKSAKEEFRETDDLIIGPPHLGRWSYACSKLMDEFMALACHQEHGVPVVVARLFNTVGPRQTGRYGMVVPRFVEAARANQPLRVFGDGRQTRCFCHVADTVEALVRLSRLRSASGEVFNIGSTEEVSITELAVKVKEITGSSSLVEYIPYSTAYKPGFEDMMRRRPCVEKLERHTGFRPSKTLDSIIRSV